MRVIRLIRLRVESQQKSRFVALARDHLGWRWGFLLLLVPRVGELGMKIHHSEDTKNRKGPTRERKGKVMNRAGGYFQDEKAVGVQARGSSSLLPTSGFLPQSRRLVNHTQSAVPVHLS